MPGRVSLRLPRSIWRRDLNTHQGGLHKQCRTLRMHTQDTVMFLYDSLKHTSCALTRPHLTSLICHACTGD
jgi:hypothetical protein